MSIGLYPQEGPSLMKKRQLQSMNNYKQDSNFKTEVQQTVMEMQIGKLGKDELRAGWDRQQAAIPG